MSLKKYVGSCHCGAVQFSALLDLANMGTTKCNCTICTKIRSWEGLAKPSDFAITRGEEYLTKYLYGRRVFPHYFCRYCGVHTHLTGTLPVLGETVMVQVNCIDNVDPRELVSAPVRYINNLEDKPQEPPPYTEHL